jgi:hypothetical protein
MKIKANSKIFKWTNMNNLILFIYLKKKNNYSLIHNIAVTMKLENLSLNISSQYV